MLYLWIWGDLTPIAITTWLSLTTEQDILKSQRSSQQHFNQQDGREAKSGIRHIGLEHSWELTTDHHLTPKFGKTEGFHHHQETESSMKMLNKTEQIAHFKVEIVPWQPRKC